MRTLRLAERLGAETTILTGEKTSEELVSYARKLNITKIVIGKPAQTTMARDSVWIRRRRPDSKKWEHRRST